MIEISHQQARRLIRRNLDAHLPEEQWNALQAHLETCAECRAYQDRLSLTEKNIRRALKTSWNVVPGPDAGLPQGVTKARGERAAVRRRVMIASGAVAALLIFYLAGGFDFLFRPASPAAPLSATEIPKPTASPVPTLAVGEFRGVVAYDSTTRDGGTAIFLLNPGAGSGSPGNGTNESVPDVLLDPSAFNKAGASGGLQDSDPSWSPDGEWVALLSARGTGKKEVFVSNVAGSRVVQLTDEPDISWEGPLSWSADGQWVALTGIRTNQGNQRWIYRVPVNGSGPVALEGGRNGYDPEFSPAGDRLAYDFADGTHAGVIIQHLDGNETVSSTWMENTQALPPAAGSGVDWSQDGTSLAYIAGPSSSDQGGSSAQGERIVASRELNYSLSSFYDSLRSFDVTTSPWPGAYRGVTWAPFGGLLYLENVDDSRAHDAPGQTTTGCWTIQVRLMGFRGGNGSPNAQSTPGAASGNNPNTSATPGTGFRPRNGFAGSTESISGLCVESGIDRSSWTADGQWLVVLGRTPEEMASGAPRGLYAVRLPRPYDRTTGKPVESRIIRLAALDGAAGMPRVRPALRRSANPLNIDPQPVQKHTVLSNSDLRLATGLVYYAHRQGNGSVIVSMSPDGTGGKTLFGSDGSNRCPGPSPDGSWVAFVSDWNSPKTDRPGTAEPSSPAASPEPPDAAYQQAQSNGAIGGGNEIFVMDSNGSNITQISSQEVIPETGPRPGMNVSPAIYGCPVWSRDGKYLAAMVETPIQWYLGIFAVENGKPVTGEAPRYARTGRPSAGLEPRWAADGRRVLLVQTDSGKTTPSILAVDIPGGPAGDLIARPLSDGTAWDHLAGLDISPDGRRAAVIGLQDHADGKIATLIRFDTRLGYQFSQVPLGIDYSNRPLQADLLAWGASGDIGLILQNGALERYKTSILRFDGRDHRIDGQVVVEDVLYDAAWSPDGHWVIYSTESGLWVADIDAVRSGQAEPTWISPQPVFDLAWK